MRITMEQEDGEVLLCSECENPFSGKIAYLDIDVEGECLDGVFCPHCATQSLHRKASEKDG